MHDGQKSQDRFPEVLENFVKPDSKFAPYIFWFYDEDLDSLGIKPQEMAHELAKKGFNPGYAHARVNYASTFAKRNSTHIRPLPKEQWLSDRWFEVLEKQCRQAAADGVHLSYADDYGWPSMQAGGKLVEADPTLKSKNLRYRYIDLEKGGTVSIEGCFFAVAGARIYTERTSYVELMPEADWKHSKASFDQTPPGLNNTLPLNMASAWSDSPDAVCVYHITLPKDGKYMLYACCDRTGDNSADAVYEVQGRKIHVNQREGIYRWNLLGEFYLSGGACTVTLKNNGGGRVSADGIKAVAEDGVEIILDEAQTTDRQIAYLDSDSLTVLNGDSYTAESDCRVYLFSLQEHRGYDGSTIDYLQRRTSDLFLDAVWRPSYEKLHPYMGSGRPVNGIFSDHEGDYGYKLAWSEDLRDYFYQKYTEDIRRILPLLIDRDVQGQDVVWRYRWFDAVSDLYAAHFHKISGELSKHGLYFTIHTWEESLQLQAACVGDVFKLNRGVSLPGTDALCRVAYNPQNFKDLFSVAEFEGVRLMDEVMALIGIGDYTPDELKKQANYLAAYGVGHVINHAVKMTRELAQSVVTPDFYNIDPCWQAMEQYTDFVRRTSYINSLGRANAQALVINPLDSMYALAENDVFDMDFEMLDVGGGIPKICASFGGEAGEINRQYGELIRILTRQRVEHMSADKEYLSRMEIQNGSLCYGDYVFHTVIIPRVTVLDMGVVLKIAQFAQNGGEVHWIGPPPRGTLQGGRGDKRLSECLEELAKLPGVHWHNSPAELELESNIKILDGCKDLLSHWRMVDGRHFIFLCRNSSSGDSTASVVCLPNVHGKTILLDPATGDEVPANAVDSEDGLILCLSFAPYQAWYIVVDPSEKQRSSFIPKETAREIPLTEWTAYIDRGNTEKSLLHQIGEAVSSGLRLILRKGCFDDPIHPDVERIELLCGGEAVFSKEIRKSFTVEYDEVAEISAEFPETKFDSVQVTSDRGLTSYWVEIREGELWRTVVDFDTYSQNEVISPIDYPAGVHNVSLTDWSEWDFLPANFAGVVTYRTSVKLTGTDLTGDIRLEIEKFLGSVMVNVNGVHVGKKMFAPFEFSVGDVMAVGENIIELRVSNTISCNVCGKRGGIRKAAIKIYNKGEQQ